MRKSYMNDIIIDANFIVAVVDDTEVLLQWLAQGEIGIIK